MKNKYESPLNLRYASDEMSYLFSADYKFSTWRKFVDSIGRNRKGNLVLILQTSR